MLSSVAWVRILFFRCFLSGLVVFFAAYASTLYAQDGSVVNPVIDWTQIAVQLASMLTALGVVGTVVAKLIVEPMINRKFSEVKEWIRDELEEYTKREDFDASLRSHYNDFQYLRERIDRINKNA